MLLSYVKVPATHYALHFQQGRIRREGLGLSFFYYAPSATIAAIPMGSTDAPFAFVESTADFQQATVQGQLTYRVADPKKVASLLDFSIGSKAQYLADGPLKLQERLVKEAQVAARAVTQRMTLPEVLISATAIGTEVSEALKTSESITSLGVEIMSLAVISIKPTPEMAKALEASAREALQRKSDEAIYARRNAAVEQERRIKESELNTELAVEEKKRQIREVQMAAEIAIEEQRALLMDQKVANERKDADSRAYAMEVTAKAIETMDWKKLMLISPGGFDAGQVIALAFQELAGNAQKIGELNISPDLLQGLMSKKEELAMFEKVFVITRKTRLAELVERFNTVGQARFYIEHAGGDFGEYESEDTVYRMAVEETRRSLPSELKVHALDRSPVPTVLFTEKDLIVTLGQDGVVANTAKYVKGQPIIAVNPDTERFDGILMPFLPTDVRGAIAAVLGGKEHMREVTMAEARLQDGQRILAFNDLFIGANSHVSARYKITLQGKTEYQSSSGILVSTGAGSTGWISSVFNMAGGLATAMGGTPLQRIHMDWEDPRLFFVAREPFISRHSTADLVTGWIGNGEELLVESTMPSGGCVFSDGIEADSVEFNSGAILHVQRSKEKARLVIA